MAKQMTKEGTTTASRGVKALYERARTFIEEVRTELGKVTWPTSDDLKVSTKVTMLLLGIMAGITFGFDLTFARIMLAILSLAS